VIIYPPKLHTTNSARIFFIGSAKDFCLINDNEIDLIYAGNFCPVFDLDLGENEFKVNLDGEVFHYKVIREEVSKSTGHSFISASESLSSLLGQFSSGTASVQRICLDPGHGGNARGTASPKGVAEKDLNLSLALKLKQELSDKGYEVLLTREEDCDLELSDRVKLAKDFSSDLFLSLHHNAVADNFNPMDFRGVSCHYYYDELAVKAANLAHNISQLVNLQNLGAVKQNLHVLRENDFCPAFLIEFGYLIHPIESELISSSEFQDFISSKFEPKILFSS
jgi:N-acetylmuramoyl-L-alanine amidase